MSTNINITKRIDIQEEGVTITPNVNSINFVGDGVTASAVGQDVTVNISGGTGSVVYYLNQTISQTPYREFSSLGTSAVEQVVPATVAGGATATIAEFQTPPGIPNTTIIPQGLWQFFLHFNAGAAGQNWIIRPLVYKRDLGGIETLIFTPDPTIVTNMSVTTTMYTCDGVLPVTNLLTTDRLVVKINMENTTGAPQTVNFRTEGSQHYSVATTTLNQSIPSGSVLSVTGTAPVVSSGGSNPAISMPPADTSTDGYLTAIDWNIFDNKPDLLSELGDVDTLTVLPTNDQVLTFDSSTGLWKPKSIVSQDDAPLLFVMAATDAALGFVPTYYNGPANDGIGATLTATLPGVLTDNTAVGRIDTNYIPDVGDLILVKNQVNQFHNGVYEISDTGSVGTPYILTRSIDADAPVELYPLQINVFQGLVNGSKYFTQTNTAWGNAIPPVVGFDNIIFALTSLTTSPLQITFVDHSTVAPLPSCVYTIGPDLTKPGVGATLSATAAGALVLSGMAAGSSTSSLTAFTTLLVRNEVEPRYNGTYQVINPGSTTAKWILRRIDDLAAGFNKALRIVFCSHNVSPFAGTYYTPTWNPTLINKNIGIVSFPLATNRIDYATFTPQAGKFGIANSNGAFTYYATLSSAMTAAVAGQTIEMFTDVTETGIVSIALKQGVDINGNGHTYTYTNSAGVMFTYILPGGVITTTINILNLNIVRTNGASTAAAVFGSFTNPSGTSTTTLNFINSTVTYTATSGATPIVDAIASLHIVTVNGLTCTSNGSAVSPNQGVAVWCSSANFCTITCTGTAHGYRGGTINNSRITTASGNGVEVSSAVSCIIRCTSSGIGIREGNATDTTITTNTGDCMQSGNVIAQGVANRCNVSSTSGICYRRIITTNCTGSTGANTVLDHWFNYNDNTAKFRRNYFVCNSAVPVVINGTGGDFELVDSTIVQNGTGPGVRLYGSVVPHPVQDVINCTIILPTSSAANCITAAAAPGNARYINNKFKGATTPINTNVVQFVVNTIDNQGNILL